MPTRTSPVLWPCLIRRSELLRLQGEWEQVLTDVQRACVHLERRGGAEDLGLALYELGEMHRLLGNLEAAETAFHQVARAGRSPHADHESNL